MTGANGQRKTAEIIFRDDLYPRMRTDATTVQKYAEDLTVLPPIEVNQRDELIDGWHRWTAHKKMEAVEISVFVTETRSDGELLEFAIERNATHGLQLSQKDKQEMARRIYHQTPDPERKAKKKRLEQILSVSDRVIRDWLSRIDKDARQARNQRIFEKWLACWTQEEIAEAENLTQRAVSDVIEEVATLPKLLKPDKAAAEHATDFKTPLYNVWKQAEKTTSSNHFGTSELRWLDNLVYLYTEPFDVVVDLFAGSGSTIDLCRKRFRRYWVSDRLPVVEREAEVRKHDITTGLPRLPQWKDVRLVYLDPPYWKQAEGKYSKDATDLANMELAAFGETLVKLVRSLARKMTNGYIAMLMQPTQWKAPDREYTDHVAELLCAIKLPVHMRIQCPYESQQCTVQMVEWAKENKEVLVLSREIMVWRTGK